MNTAPVSCPLDGAACEASPCVAGQDCFLKNYGGVPFRTPPTPELLRDCLVALVNAHDVGGPCQCDAHQKARALLAQ